MLYKLKKQKKKTNKNKQKKQRFFSAEPLRYLIYLRFEPHVVWPVVLFLLKNL